MAFTKPSVALHLPRLTGGNQRYTDTNEFLSPGVLIAYHARPAGTVYPSLADKTAVNLAAIQARNAVRIANDKLASVVILRRDESAVFTATMERHFNLSSTGGLAGGLLTDNTIDKPFNLRDVFKLDRRWALEQIRQSMLSLSFHLNTGIYLIDMDEAQRTSIGGQTIVAGSVLAAGDEAYTYAHALDSRFPLCGFRNGEIHIDFGLMTTNSLNSGARVIIHEAAHKFLNPQPDTYAWDNSYPPALGDCLEGNPDSFAWGAISLATGVLAMAPGSPDWNQCPGGAL